MCSAVGVRGLRRPAPSIPARQHDVAGLVRRCGRGTPAPDRAPPNHGGLATVAGARIQSLLRFPTRRRTGAVQAFHQRRGPASPPPWRPSSQAMASDRPEPSATAQRSRARPCLPSSCTVRAAPQCSPSADRARRRSWKPGPGPAGTCNQKAASASPSGLHGGDVRPVDEPARALGRGARRGEARAVVVGVACRRWPPAWNSTSSAGRGRAHRYRGWAASTSGKARARRVAALAAAQARQRAQAQAVLQGWRNGGKPLCKAATIAAAGRIRRAGEGLGEALLPGAGQHRPWPPGQHLPRRGPPLVARSFATRAPARLAHRPADRQAHGRGDALARQIHLQHLNLRPRRRLSPLRAGP